MTITAQHRDVPQRARFASGAFIDTGTVKKSVIKLGFTPRKVTLVNATDRLTYEWYQGMAADTYIYTIANGTRTLEVTAGITVSDLASGTAGSWTVYEKSEGVVGTPAVAAAEETDCSRLNVANEVISGFNCPASILTTSKQFYWTAED